MSAAIRYLQTNIKSAIDYGAESGKKELRDQGHKVSGKLEKSIHTKVSGLINGVLTGEISALDYGNYLDKGVRKNRIRYNPKILLPWIRKIKPGLSVREQISFAYAIRAKHRKEGMPTRNSYSFSKNGRRKGWIKNGIVNKQKEIDEIINLVGFLDLLVTEGMSEFKSAA